MADYMQLTPDISQPLSSGLQVGMQLGQIGRNQAEQERQQQSKAIVGGILSQGNITGQQLAQLPEMQELYKYDPDAAIQLSEYADKRDAAGLERIRYNNQRQSEIVYPLAAIADPEQQRLEAIRQAQQFAKSQDPNERETAQELIDIANMPPEARKARLMQAAIQSKAGDNAINLLFGAPKEKEGFTLGEGQIRYDASGNVIASGPQKTGPAETDKTRFDQATKLRTEVEKFTDEFRKVEDPYDRVNSIVGGAGKKDASADIALVYSFMKMLDPGSVVRETEFATAQNAAGVPEQLRNQYNKVLSGEFLSPEQVKSFKNQAEKIYKGAESRQKKRESQYTGLAKKYGIDPTEVIIRSPAQYDNPPANFGVSDQPEGTIATNPQTGQTIVSRGGVWVAQ
jgi:hypothetical protein